MPARLIQLLSICSVAALFTGCGDKLPSPEDLAKYSSKALGLPVFMWAKSDDYCVSKQLFSFYGEYKKASDEEKKQLVEKFKAYSAIIVQVSEDVGILERHNTVVHLNAETSKTLHLNSEWKTSSGKYPGTRIELGGDEDGTARELYITPTFAKDLSSTRTYQTSDASLYAALASNSLIYLEAAVKNGKLKLVSDKQAAPVSCGKLATLADLFGKK